MCSRDNSLDLDKNWKKIDNSSNKSQGAQLKNNTINYMISGHIQIPQSSQILYHLG